MSHNHRQHRSSASLVEIYPASCIKVSDRGMSFAIVFYFLPCDDNDGDNDKTDGVK
jgi:hypothetical protein